MLGIESITSSIRNLFDNKLRTAANIIPGIIMICALAKRPGLSCLISFGNIVQEMEKEGMPTGPLPDGTPNLMNKMVKSVVCEVFRAMKEDANIQVALAPGSVNIVATGRKRTVVLSLLLDQILTLQKEMHYYNNKFICYEIFRNINKRCVFN